ncbi:hypothetical protein [Nostoc sp.]|uniref:hypothetical protein n=1 Tax=Nostoc sp. TaxID=1180 RepID=UPI002FEFCE90
MGNGINLAAHQLTMALLVDTMALLSDTMALSVDTMALLSDTMALSVDTMALSSDTMALSVDTMALQYIAFRCEAFPQASRKKTFKGSDPRLL